MNSHAREQRGFRAMIPVSASGPRPTATCGRPRARCLGRSSCPLGPTEACVIRGCIGRGGGGGRTGGRRCLPEPRGEARTPPARGGLSTGAHRRHPVTSAACEGSARIAPNHGGRCRRPSGQRAQLWTAPRLAAAPAAGWNSATRHPEFPLHGARVPLRRLVSLLEKHTGRQHSVLCWFCAQQHHRLTSRSRRAP